MTIYELMMSKNENDRMKAEELKQKIAEIKSYRKPPFIKTDAYYDREPWKKFGAVGGFVLGWGWYKDEYIFAQATPEDVEMAYNGIIGGIKQ